jgi:hypothetical protein
MAKHSRYAARFRRASFCHARDREWIARLHDAVIKRETGSDKRKPGVGLPFGLPLSGFVARMERSEIRGGIATGLSLPDCASLHPGYEENEGSGTPANAGYQPPHLAVRRAPIRSAHACRRSTAALT